MSSPAATRPDSGSAVAAQPWWTRCARSSALWLGLPLLALLTLLLSAWLALHWAILPHINDWRPELEKQATRALGVPVRIGSIRANSSRWIPALDLRDVRLIDARGRDALLLPRVSAAISARSLLAFELRFSQLLLDRPELLLRRDAQGRVFVAGLSLDGPADTPASDAAADWFFKQHEFVILHGRIRWVDDLRGAPPIMLDDLNLVLRNGLRRHRVRLDATPPAGWGERFTLRGQFTQSLLERPGALDRWTGQLYGDLPRTNVQQLRRYVDLPFQLNEGDGALRAWLDIDKGTPRSLTLDMGLRAVKLRVAPGLPELSLAQIAGRLVLRQTDQLVSLEAQQLGFQAGDGLDWPRSDWRVQLRRDARSGQFTGGDAQAESLDLALAAQIAARLPLAESQRRLIADMQPTGHLNALQLHWEGPADAPRSYRAKGRLEQLQLAAGTAAAPASADAPPPIARPGVRGASLHFEATEQGGTAALAIADGELDLPGVLLEPQVPVHQGQASLTWRALRKPAAPPQWQVQFGGVRIANDDLQLDVDGSWTSGAGRRAHDSGRLDLTGRIEQIAAPRVLRYLPATLGADARRYIRDAIPDGSVHQIHVRLLGDLDEFPFDGPRSKGQFKVTGQVRDVSLAYVPSHPADDLHAASSSAWPAMEQVNAELVFDRASMSIRNGRARLMGVELTNVQGHVADLYHHQPVLEISGQGRGALSDGLRYVRASPVAALTSHVLDPAVATGPLQLGLQLRLPLSHIDATTVKGQVVLAGNDVRLRPDVPLMAQARGRIEFDDKGLTIRGGQARVLGGDATFEGGTQADGQMRFVAQGVVTAEGLRQAPELGAARAASVLSGQAPVRFELAIHKGQPEVTVTSSLQGLGIALPAPLNKAADESWPLRVTTRALVAPPGTQRDELRIDAGPVAALYQRDITDTPRVLRGAIAVRDKLPELPAQGVTARAVVDQLNTDAWQTALTGLLPEAGSGGAAGTGTATATATSTSTSSATATGSATATATAAATPTGTATAGAAAAAPHPSLPASGYAPQQLTLQAQSLQLAGRTLNRVAAGLSYDKAAGWRVSVDAEQLSGVVEVRAAVEDQPGRVYARLSRLSVPRSDTESVEQLLEKQPRSVPALDIVVDDFELRGKRLGRLEVLAQQQSETREWRLDKLTLHNADATLSATGQWAPQAGAAGRRTELDWKMAVTDAGKLLERLGQGQVLRAGEGELKGRISWQGSPLSPDYASMTGQLQVDVERGQFLKAEPGVGRLLGVLSLQSLPRRLMLDFRDVFSEGFAFDHVGGDIRITRGVAHSDNLRMRGLQAAVLMEGTANLASETQDLRVLVVPEINAGGAALAYAAVNPAIALGTFVAQWLLRKPIAAANTEEFRVTGTWSDPRIEQLPRRSPAPGASSGHTTASGEASP